MVFGDDNDVFINGGIEWSVLEFLR
ncbi:unnamed protein product, partial [Rotaria magnacalcarata]